MLRRVLFSVPKKNGKLGRLFSDSGGDSGSVTYSGGQAYQGQVPQSHTSDYILISVEGANAFVPQL
jgi:hypothetical protein